LEYSQEKRLIDKHFFLWPSLFLWMESELEFCYASQFSFSIWGNSEKVIRSAGSASCLADCFPLEEVGAHITTDFLVARRSAVIIDPSSPPIGENTRRMKNIVFFCDEQSTSIVRLKRLDEIPVISEHIVRKSIALGRLIEEIKKFLQIGFPSRSVYIVSFYPLGCESSFLCETNIISTFFSEILKQKLLSLISELYEGGYGLNKSSKRSFARASLCSTGLYQRFDLEKEVIFVYYFHSYKGQKVIAYDIPIDPEHI
jgi:hypothetical protein